MPWYAWAFDGIGAVIAAPLIGWVTARFLRKRSAPTTEVSSQSDAQAVTGNSPAPSLTSGPSHPPDTAPRLLVPEQPGPPAPDLADLLLAIPGMTDPAFRQRLYERLPRDVAQQLHLDSRAARIELVGLIDTFSEYPHLSPWRSLLSRLEQLLPAHPSVQFLAAELARNGLV
jgi:hypothetical protein